MLRRQLPRPGGFNVASALLLLSAAAVVLATVAVAEEDAAEPAEKTAEADFPKTAAVVAKSGGTKEARGKNT